MIPAEVPQALPDHTGRPHLTRTAVWLALTGAALFAGVWLVSELARPAYDVPPQVVQHRYDRPPHPASIYTPPGTR